MNATNEFIERRFVNAPKYSKSEKQAVLHHEFYTRMRRGKMTAADFLNSNLYFREKLCHWFRYAYELRRHPESWHKYLNDYNTCMSSYCNTSHYHQQILWALWISDYLEVFHLDRRIDFIEHFGFRNTNLLDEVYYQCGRRVFGNVDLKLLKQWRNMRYPELRGVSNDLVTRNLKILLFSKRNNSTLSKAKILSSSLHEVGLPIHVRINKKPVLNYSKSCAYCASIIATVDCNLEIPFIEVLEELDHRLAVDSVRRYRQMTLALPTVHTINGIDLDKDTVSFEISLMRCTDDLQDETLLKYVVNNIEEFASDPNFKGVIARIEAANSMGSSLHFSEKVADKRSTECFDGNSTGDR